MYLLQKNKSQGYAPWLLQLRYTYRAITPRPMW